MTSLTIPAFPALDYAIDLMQQSSITPATGGVFAVMEAMLSRAGFTVTRTLDGDLPGNEEDGGPVENLFAIRGDPKNSDAPHFAFAGHLDVVPPGEGWASGPFAPEIRGGLLYGRGAVDMKGSIAAFVAAVEQIPADAGTISLIITGDEEGPALHGTRALMRHMDAAGVRPDMILVGEPTSVVRLGDMIKIGRRGSVNMWVRVEGTQGHVAYPHLADNPIPRLVKILAEIEGIVLDEGTDWFQASNIEVTDLTVGNPAHNVIPAAAEARLSIRFNDLHSGASLTERLTQVVERGGGTLKAIISGEPFLTQPGAFSSLIAGAIREVTGIEPELSTSGGTSDARFLAAWCPVVEFGLCNATMHRLDEAVAVADLAQLTEIYRLIVERALAAK